MTRTTGVLIICASALISFLLANTVDMTNYGLGGLINLFWPPFVGLLSVLLFLLLGWFIKTSKTVILIVVLLSIYNIYVGLALHLEKENWPLVIF